MAKKKKEEPVVDNEAGSLKVKEKQEQQPTGNETKGNVTKVKAKMRKPAEVIEESITKVDLSKPPKTKEDAVQERKTEKVDVEEQTGDGEKVDGGGEKPIVEEVKVQDEKPVQDEEISVLEEVTEEEINKKVEEVAETAGEAIKESLEQGTPLPDGVQKLVDFMEETGGDLNDYIKLNQDYSEMDNLTLLQEYYKQTKPHLDSSEIEFLMEDNFSYSEDIDDEKDIKRKKLALKEQVAGAKEHLDGLKSKYYEDIKNGSKLTSEQQ